MENKRREIYTYQAPWLIFAMNWSVRQDQKFRLALGSFLEDYTNKVEIIQLNEEVGEFQPKTTFDHPYPATKISWNPDRLQTGPDLLATTGDYLRIWELKSNNQIELKSLLNNNKTSEFCAPLTSFDWNEYDPSIIGTSSIDTTCTIWNIETQQCKTQLIAHDKEVYDIAFARGTDVFASVGADGSVRMFDLRSLDHSTIIYESTGDLFSNQFLKNEDGNGLVRLAWNKQDPNYLAVIPMDSNKTIILDIRVPSVPACELYGHQSSVNGVCWAPHSSCHICTCADDKQALIWDLSSMPKPIEDPILAYTAESEINQLQWSTSQPDWIAIAYHSKLQTLRV